MSVEIRLAAPEQRYILQNLWPAYMHDLSQYQTHLPNKHGLLDEEEVVTYSDENFLTSWSAHLDKIFIFLIYSDNCLAGFTLVASPPLIEGKSDKLIHDFFLFHAFRGKGIGQVAASQVFETFKGSWQLRVLPENKPALKFWQKTVSSYSGGNFVLDEEQLQGTPMISFTFTA
ncbi:MAG TPA: GNAT family N-acetyltransferase [Xenococcaceae cyanobacterium]